MKLKIDEIDLSILSILQENSRTSYREIQNELNISIGTIHNRIHKLRKYEIIKGYSLKLNCEKLGYELTCLIRIKTRGNHTSELLQELSNKQEIIAVFQITGKESAEIICKFRDMKEAHEFIGKLNEKENIIKTESNMVLKEYKNNPHIEFNIGV